MPAQHEDITPDPAARARLPMLGIVAVWTLWGIWSSQQTSLAAMLTGQPAPARTSPWLLTMVSAWFWALMTVVVMWIARRIRDRIASPPSRIAAHVLAFAGLHLVDVAVYRLAANLIGSGPQRDFLPQLFALVTFNGLAYTAVVFIITSLDAARALRERTIRQSRLETQLALAQFHALRAQLHPHFLFNALNAISSLIHTDPARADRMLARISELLRLCIDTALTPEVSLRDELAFADRYLEIERMRYGDRLAVRIDIAAGIADALVPSMLLQPLLENAVRHGVAPHAHPGHVEVRAARQGDELHIVVRDSGAGFDPDAAPGVGLSSTRERLAKLYGPAQRLAFAGVPGGFETRLRLPFRPGALAA